MSVHRLIYISSGRKKFSVEELTEILSTSKRNNKALDISGLLLYMDGNFLQILEGETDVVSALYDRIEADPRHFGAMVLSREDAAERVFPDWGMGFQKLEPGDHIDNAGAFRLTTDSLSEKMPDNADALAQSLINSFMQVNSY